jgi:hypothetical protein
MLNVEANTRQQFLSNRIRGRFIETALERHRNRSAPSHLKYMSQLRHIWTGCHSDTTCFLCVAQNPIKTLTCGHSLCRACTVICGSPSGPSQYNIDGCPLCGEYNENSINLLPRTAGIRILKLGGSAANKFTISKFLKDFQTLVGLPLCPLREQFDLVIGQDIGEILLLFGR